MSNSLPPRPTADVLRARVEEAFPALVDELAELVAIPSVSSDPAHAEDVVASARHVRDRFAGLGLEAEVLTAPGPDGTPGRPAVVARTRPVDGAPTVLLYAHHDVQPTGDVSHWSSSPFVAEVRDGRMYGRGASDDGAGIIVHLGALRVLGEDLGVNVVVYVEGEEEVGSPSFQSFLATYTERLKADVIVVADSGNWKVGQPALTTTLRGNCVATVDVRVLDHAVHSGAFGGPVLDALTLAARLIATLHDEDGAVAVAGLGGATTSEVDWPEEDFRRDAGVVRGYHLAGRGDLAARVWTMPAINITGLDARAVADASNTIAPHCRFKVSMRTVPGADPKEAMDALVAHLLSHAPFGSDVRVTPEEYGPGYAADLTSPVAAHLHEALDEAWGVRAVNIGQGGSIPFIADFQKTFPDAQVVVTGVEDPTSNAHSEDESQSLSDLSAAVLAEALLLASLAEQA